MNPLLSGDPYDFDARAILGTQGRFLSDRRMYAIFGGLICAGVALLFALASCALASRHGTVALQTAPGSVQASLTSISVIARDAVSLKLWPLGRAAHRERLDVNKTQAAVFARKEESEP